MKYLLVTFLLCILAFYSNAQWIQVGLDIDGKAAGDESGQSVSMNALGNRLAIGAPLSDAYGAFDRGQVRVYEWDSTSMAWTQLGADIVGEFGVDYSGSSVSMNDLGDRLVIGARRNDGNGNNSGHVRIYEWNGTAWVQVGSDIDGELAGDESGLSVSMNAVGDRLVIGAHLNDGNGADAGQARIYEWNGTTWSQMAGDIDGEASGDRFGSSVSMNAVGDRIAIGAFLNDGNGSNSGHVRIYEWDPISTAWTQLGTDIDGEAVGDESGRSVSLNAKGNRLAIGAPKNDGNGSNSGNVRVYEWDSVSTRWTQIGTDIDGEAINDKSGRSVSINEFGNRLVIGAPINAGILVPSGHVRIYEWDSLFTTWVQIGADIDGESVRDQSGSSVSMNAAGDQIVIGAPLNDGNGSQAGHVRVYEFPPCIMSSAISSKTNVSCLGGDNGSITISVDSGIANYNYTWSDSSTTLNVSDTFNTINGLVAGQYFVTISDANNCTVIDSVTISVLDSTIAKRDTLITSECGEYTWFVNNQLYSSSGFYQDTTLSALGCDSVYHLLDLSIVNIDTTITQINGLNLSSNDTTTSYQWIDCNNGNSPIVGDTNRTFTATSNGNYAVALSKNACADTSACIQILTVGLDDATNKESSINLYPNPNNGSFTISVSPKYLAKTYQIFDVKGSLVKEGQFANQISTIDLSAFDKGVYYLQISEEGIREKIVIY